MSIVKFQSLKYGFLDSLKLSLNFVIHLRFGFGIYQNVPEYPPALLGG